MGDFVQRDMCGSLFKNDKREKDSHPNAKGSANIGGVDYWVSAWTKKDKNGNAWQSLSFQPKDQKPTKAETSQRRDAGFADSDLDDEIPF